MMCDGNFPQLWHHPEVGMPGKSFPTLGHPPRMLFDGRKKSWTHPRSQISPDHQKKPPAILRITPLDGYFQCFPIWQGLYPRRWGIFHGESHFCISGTFTSRIAKVVVLTGLTFVKNKLQLLLWWQALTVPPRHVVTQHHHQS